ncbi:transmembrane anchor protein [Desulfurivibrio sp. D14AmB]|uniref:transmembrane anchor protein n=1 Tax=Desulfurivibrio sp. D14AmB TaxID=3374370 RepID=UPI00376EE374
MQHIPNPADLPSSAKLIKSTFVAAVVAAFLLVVAILPAEYGIDPTGFGKVLGLTKMGAIKTSLAREAAAQGTIEPAAIQPVQPIQEEVPTAVEPVTELRKDSMEFSLAPNEGKEIKLTLNKGERARYAWYTDGAAANFDGHSDSVKHKIDYRSWQKGRSPREEGELVAEFDGKHGWFWRNRTSKPMKITLLVEGEYSEIETVL